MRFLPSWEIHNLTGLLEDAKRCAGKIPAGFVSDGLDSYKLHVSDAGLAKNNNNNTQERFNSRFTRPRRGIKYAYTANTGKRCRV